MSTVIKSPIVRYLDDLREVGGLKGTDVANFTKVSKATVSRWVNGQKSSHSSTGLILADLHYVVMRLSEYYNAEEVRTWLYAPHPQLDGKRAIELIHEQRTEEVLKTLDRLDADVYV